MSDAMRMSQPICGNDLHALRNRLTVVKGVAQMLARHVRRDGCQREKLVLRIDRLQEEILSLQNLIAAFETGDDESSTYRLNRPRR